MTVDFFTNEQMYGGRIVLLVMIMPHVWFLFTKVAQRKVGMNFICWSTLNKNNPPAGLHWKPQHRAKVLKNPPTQLWKHGSSSYP